MDRWMMYETNIFVSIYRERYAYRINHRYISSLLHIETFYHLNKQIFEQVIIK